MLKILTKRLETKDEPYINENQFGFRKGKGTKGGICCDESFGRKKHGT